MLVSFQIAGIVIIFILISFFLAQIRITVKSGRLFMLVCLSTFLLLFLDIFSIFSIVYSDKFNQFIVDFLAKLYLVFLVIESTFGLLYLVRDVYKYNLKRRKIFYIIQLSYIFIAAILLLSTKINAVYEADNHILYTEGPSCLICYGLSGFALITTISYVIVKRKAFNKANRDTIIIWMIFWIIAAVIQFIYKPLLIVSFASAAALIIIYINLENPALMIDKKTAKFNFELLEECITELNDKKIGYKIVYMVLNSNSIDNNLKNNALIAISNILSTFTNTKISMRRNRFLTFRSDLGFVNVLINSTSEEFFSKMKEGMHNINYDKNYADAYDITYLVIENSSIVSNFDRLKNLFEAILEKNFITLTEKINYIDATTVKKLDEIKVMEKTLNHAIENNLVEVFYQPIYSKQKKSFTSAEALVRIKDSDGKIIYPGSFIEIAERNGSISKLGEMVFINVCKFLSETNIKNLGLEYIEVNLSVVQCGDPNLANKYIEIMNKYGIDPAQINLEITETASSNLRNIMLKNMNSLIEYGVSFSLDDFGMGNSNLNYIIEMPVEIVKFDRVIVNSYFTDDKAKLVFTKIIEMIKSLRLHIVLEGIEEKDKLNDALKLDIDYIQGYYYSKPIMKNAFIKFIEENNKKD